MADVRIDTSHLTYTQFFIPGQFTTFVDGAEAPVIALPTGTYVFLQTSVTFGFVVTTDGLIDYDKANDSFLEGRGTTRLIVHGFTISLDARALSHDLLPMAVGATVLSRQRVHTLTLVPGESYRFQPGGSIADFQISLSIDGRLIVPPRYQGFARAKGRALIIDGYRITIDGRALSHALLPFSMLHNFDLLANDRVHDLTLLPSDGYGFQPGGLLADFSFEVHVDGQVVVPPRFQGFARAEGRTLVIDGYRFTLDGRQLTHDLLPFSMLNSIGVLSNDRVHELTYLPGASYNFQPGGTIADFSFEIDVSGRLSVDPRFDGFAAVSGRTLVISGYRVLIDGRSLPHDLVPVSLLSDLGVLSRNSVHELRMIPAPGYLLAAPGEPADFVYSVHANGTIGIRDVPGGLVVLRPLPPPPGLRSFYADFFMPARGSVREFCKPKQVGSLRTAIREHREGLLHNASIRQGNLDRINELFGGGTSEDEEDEALGILIGSTRAEDLVFLVNTLTWDGLDDDLDEGDLTRIMDRLKVLLDRRQYLAGFLLRAFFLVNDEALPNIDFINVLTPYAATRSPEVRHAFADQALGQRDALLDGIMLMALRNRPTSARELRLVIDHAAGAEQYRAADLQRLSWEVFYTDLIGTQLARGEYRLLQQTLTDLFNPGTQQPPFPVRNIALFNMLRRWERHFVAMERATVILGTERQKADVRRYMDTRRLFMDSFPALPAAPPAPFFAALQQAVQAITTTLSGVAGSFQDLVGAVQAIASSIGDLSAPQLLGTTDDDGAVAAANALSMEGLLAILPSIYKIELNNKMLDGAVEDEEEEGILTVLRDTKTRSPAEFLQLAGSATWEELDSSFNGTQYDDLEALFRF
jgi:hypothetical protein